MKTKYSITLLMANILIVCSSFASEKVFQSDNFRIDVPENWITPSTTFPPVVKFIMLSPDRSKMITMISGEIKDPKKQYALFDFNAGAVDSMVKEGGSIGSTNATVINGIPFILTTGVNKEGGNFSFYATSMGNFLYGIGFVSKVYNPLNDSECLGIVNSFNLINNAEYNSYTLHPTTAAYKFGYFFGKLLQPAFALLGVIFLVIGIVTFVKKIRKKS